MTVIAVLGLVTPILFGGILLSFDLSENMKNAIRIGAGAISLLQLILSALALIYKWEYIVSYSQESSYAHWVLFNKYKSLQSYPPADLNQLKDELDKIDIEQIQRDQQDAKIPPSPNDLRRGMRYALFNLSKVCAGCHKIPDSLESTSCNVCGNFLPKYKFIPAWLRL